MRLTNKFGLPETLIRGLHKQEAKYNKGEVDSSVTQLIQPPQINILRKEYYKDMEKDIAEEFWALLGSAVHHILEMGAESNQIVEERLFMTIDKWRISGAIDLQTVIGKFIDIIDYKVSSVYSVPYKNDPPKDEWVNQMNLQALLVEANKPDYTVNKLQICLIIRDWSGSEAKRRPTDYPQAPVMLVDIPLWDHETRVEYARARCEAHRHAKFQFEMGEDLPECSSLDRWVRETKFAVKKKGNKRALRVFDNPTDAMDFLQMQPANYEIEHRPGESVRCNYCGVKDWCKQYQTSIKDQPHE